MRLFTGLAAACCALALALGLAAAARAQEVRPLWELGVVMGAGYAPDYPASDEYSFRWVPLPYFVYRGEVFRAEESGMLRGRLFNNARVELDVSIAGALDVGSDKNTARTGMPDLDLMGQVGPRLQVRLAQAARDARIDFELPVRAVLSTDFSTVDYIGILSVPEIAYQHDNFAGTGTHVKVGVGATFADSRFQNVIYGVPAQFATDTRAAYEAKGGYMGAKVSLAGWRQMTERIRLFGLARADFHGGAVNEASPLFRTKTTGTVIVGGVFLFARSARTGVE
ncbi:MAG: MipA/OmpV family protein [Alphaproteobacteria bacterium]|nr:MipA/OmpV family protein [Alphaproteobacteria bacterium]